jgi:hypothetical protein
MRSPCLAVVAGVVAAGAALSGVGCTCEPVQSVDAGLDSAVVDAWWPDADGGPPPPDAFTWPLPDPPGLGWSAGISEPCRELRTPVFRPTERTGPPGTQRWRQSGGLFGDVAVEEPTFAAGRVFFTPDLVGLHGVDLETGAFAEAASGPGRPVETDWGYIEPWMTLGESLVVYRDGFSLRYYDVSGPRAVGGTWLFPELEATVDRREPLPARNRMLQHVASAWSPTTGTVAFTLGPYYRNRVVAVQCTEANAGRFLVSLEDVPAGWTYNRTHVLYRENGELLVHLGGLFVIGPTGELLRSVGLPPDSVPRAYTPECGLLYEDYNHRGQFTWWDVDAMQAGASYTLPSPWGELRILPGCRPAAGDRSGWWVGRAGEEAEMVAPNMVRLIPLDEGRVALFYSTTSELAILDSAGTETARYTLEGAENLFYLYWTPDGHVGERDVGFWELGLDPVPTYALDTGMNWAHTNSPLPQ